MSIVQADSIEINGDPKLRDLSAWEGAAAAFGHVVPVNVSEPGRWIPAIIRQGDPDDSPIWLKVRMERVDSAGRVLDKAYLDCGARSLLDHKRFAVLALTDGGIVVAWHSPREWREAVAKAIAAFNPEVGL